MSEDIVKVVIDYKCAKKGHRKEVNTGGFEQIFKGIKCKEIPLASLGLNLICKGKKI